jgi:hypothetical protein
VELAWFTIFNPFPINLTPTLGAFVGHPKALVAALVVMHWTAETNYIFTCYSHFFHFGAEWFAKVFGCLKQGWKSQEAQCLLEEHGSRQVCVMFFF